MIERHTFVCTFTVDATDTELVHEFHADLRHFLDAAVDMGVAASIAYFDDDKLVKNENIVKEAV